MTKKELERMLSVENKWSNRLNWFTLVFLFFVGSGFLLLTIDGYRQRTDLFLFLIPGLILVLVPYGFWRIPKQYEVSVVLSSASLPQKTALVQRYIESTGKVFAETETNPYRITYSVRKWWGIMRDDFQLNICISSSEFLINVRQVSGYSDGFIDMGNSHRETKKTIAFFTRHLPA